MEIKNDSEFGNVIKQWFSREFPLQIPPLSGDLLDILTDCIVGTKQLRYGSIPSPEKLVAVRETIKAAIKLGEPIPMLVAWGGRKTLPKHDLDIVEVFALNQLLKLNQSVKKYFSPGLNINIRIEDTGAYHLYRKDVDVPAIRDYSESMRRLIYILSDGSLNGILESSVMDMNKFFAESDHITPIFYKAIEAKISGFVDNATLTALKNIGWQGDIGMEQIEFYMSRYRDLYPGNALGENIFLLAEYFSGALTRYKMGGRCAPNTVVGSYLGGSFVPPIPGAPENLFNRTLYYRSIPVSWGRTHIAPWRAKGYFEIQGNELIGKIVSFKDPILHDLQKCYTYFTTATSMLRVLTPYIQIS